MRRQRICRVIVLLATPLLATASHSAQDQPVAQSPRVVARAAAAYRQALRPDIRYNDERGRMRAGIRCGTQSPTASQVEAIDTHVRRMLSQSGLDAKGDNRVAVSVHVIYEKKDGKLRKATIKKQIKVLNHAYAGQGFKFKLKDVSYTRDSSWFTGCDQQSIHRKMTKALARRPEKRLNIYSCQPQGGVLGFAFLPGTSISGTFRDSVVLLHSAFPGGGAVPYDEGDTAVHEVGHYLGLLHTFAPEPNGCRSPGDRVADTPSERTPDYLCSPRRDSCPQDNGTDLTQNFMDYGYDSCVLEFSAGQSLRMREQSGVFRPEL